MGILDSEDAHYYGDDGDDDVDDYYDGYFGDDDYGPLDCNVLVVMMTMSMIKSNDDDDDDDDNLSNSRPAANHSYWQRQPQ